MINELKLGFRMDWEYDRTQLASRVNGFLYFLRRIPLVGKFIPVKVFELYGLKLGLFILFLITHFMFELFKKILVFVSLSVALSVVISLKNDGGTTQFFSREAMPLVIGCWVIFECFLEQVFSPTWDYLKKNELNFIRFYSIYTRDFVFSRAASSVVKNLLFYIPVFLLLSFIVHSFWVVIACCLAYFSGYFLGLCLIQSTYRFFFSTKKRRFIPLTLIFIVTIGLFIFLLINNPTVFYALWSPIACVIYLVIGVISYRKSLKFKDRDDYILCLVEKSERNITAVAKAYSTNEYKTLGESMQKKLVATDASRFSNLTGSNYLNALLFERYRKVLLKSLIIRLIVIGIVGVIICVCLYQIDFSTETINSFFYRVLPISFFVVYMLGMGKNIVSMVFMNCDKAMLHYPYYKESSVIVGGFFNRFKRSLFYNGLIALEFYLFIVTSFVIKGQMLGLVYLGSAFLLYLSLAFLFSFHELFVYYMLQPFTDDMAVKNPVYSVVNVVMWLIAYGNLNIPFQEASYAIIVTVLSLLYMAIGFLIVLKFSPCTFKLRRE